MARVAEPKVADVCSRCNGRGGWEGWPGFTCYRCRGNGRDPVRKVFASKAPVVHPVSLKQLQAKWRAEYFKACGVA